MSIFDDIVQIDENGEIHLNQWIEWQHISKGVIHCPVCIALDKCWFDENKMPILPQHDNCHCTKKIISTPKVGVNIKAECDIKKFSDYIFSDKYAWNGKRDLFKLLGFDKDDSVYLKSEYEKQAEVAYSKSKYTLGKLDFRGQRIQIDIQFTRNGRNIVFTSGWMVKQYGMISNNTPLAD